MEKHYDESYFFPNRYGGKRYLEPSGKESEFCFNSGTIQSWKRILSKLIALIGSPESVLDVGAGLGVWVEALNRNGIFAHGLEFSKCAIEHAGSARNYLTLWNIEEIPWPLTQKFYWSTAIDLFEHLFDEDVDRVIAEMKRVSERFIIAKICTAQTPNEVWAAKKQAYPQVLEQAKMEGFEWLVASGHINSQTPNYWLKKLEDADWKNKSDLVQIFKQDMPIDWRTTMILSNEHWFENEFGKGK